MKILLDECLPVDFRHQLVGHEVHSAEWAGFKGLKMFPHQQNMSRLKVSIIVIRANTNQIEDLLPLVGTILAKLGEIQPGQVAIVG